MSGLNEWPFLIQGRALIAQGVDIGPRPTVVARKDDILAVKIGGHKTWASIGSSRYMPARFYVFKVLSEEKPMKSEGVHRITLRPLLNFTVRGESDV